jgi:hypothetical protein
LEGAQCSLDTCSPYPNLLLEAGKEVRRWSRDANFLLCMFSKVNFYFFHRHDWIWGWTWMST